MDDLCWTCGVPASPAHECTTTPGELWVVFKDGEIIGTHRREWAARTHVEDDDYLGEGKARGVYKIVQYVESAELDL